MLIITRMGAQQDASFKAEENWLDKRLVALFEQPQNPGSKRGYRSDCLALPGQSPIGGYEGRLIEILGMAGNDA